MSDDVRAHTAEDRVVPWAEPVCQEKNMVPGPIMKYSAKVIFETKDAALLPLTQYTRRLMDLVVAITAMSPCERRLYDHVFAKGGMLDKYGTPGVNTAADVVEAHAVRVGAFPDDNKTFLRPPPAVRVMHRCNRVRAEFTATGGALYALSTAAMLQSKEAVEALLAWRCGSTWAHESERLVSLAILHPVHGTCAAYQREYMVRVGQGARAVYTPGVPACKHPELKFANNPCARLERFVRYNQALLMALYADSLSTWLPGDALTDMRALRAVPWPVTPTLNIRTAAWESTAIAEGPLYTTDMLTPVPERDEPSPMAVSLAPTVVPGPGDSVDMECVDAGTIDTASRLATLVMPDWMADLSAAIDQDARLDPNNTTEQCLLCGRTPCFSKHLCVDVLEKSHAWGTMLWLASTAALHMVGMQLESVGEGLVGEHPWMSTPAARVFRRNVWKNMANVLSNVSVSVVALHANARLDAERDAPSDAARANVFVDVEDVFPALMSTGVWVMRMVCASSAPSFYYDCTPPSTSPVTASALLPWVGAVHGLVGHMHRVATEEYLWLTGELDWARVTTMATAAATSMGASPDAVSPTRTPSAAHCMLPQYASGKHTCCAIVNHMVLETSKLGDEAVLGLLMVCVPECCVDSSLQQVRHALSHLASRHVRRSSGDVVCTINWLHGTSSAPTPPHPTAIVLEGMLSRSSMRAYGILPLWRAASQSSAPSAQAKPLVLRGTQHGEGRDDAELQWIGSLDAFPARCRVRSLWAMRLHHQASVEVAMYARMINDMDEFALGHAGRFVTVNACTDLARFATCMCQEGGEGEKRCCTDVAQSVCPLLEVAASVAADVVVTNTLADAQHVLHWAARALRRVVVVVGPEAGKESADDLRQAIANARAAFVHRIPTLAWVFVCTLSS